MASLPVTDGRRAAAWALLAWLLCGITMLWLFHSAFPTLAFRDPDDAMRLAQVRDWVAGQAFWDVSQHRVNPPVGGPMHWSRIVDMPIAGLILLLRPIFGVGVAEIAACALAPLLLLGGLTVALFVAVRRIAGAGVALLAVILLLTAPSILTQFTPLRIDHHGWQIAMAAVALCGAVDGRPKRGGIVTGLALAVWLQISSEALPYAALFAATFALRQWITRDQAPRFIAFALALGGAALPLLILLRGPQAVVARQCDALSHVYVWPLVALVLATALAARLIGMRTPLRRMTIAMIGGGAALATFLGTGGPCLSGDPFAALGPVAYRLWYLQVMEGRPIWDQSRSMAGVILLPCILGLGATLMAARATRGDVRATWLTVALLLVGATGVAVMVMRALSVAHLFALPGLGWMMLGLFHRIQASRFALLRIAGSTALIIPSPAGLCALSLALINGPERQTEASTSCRAARAIAPLRALPTSTLFAPVDIGPDILVQTPHSVVATGHHRNAVGITAVVEGFVAAPDAARRIINQTQAHYIVTCAGLNEMPFYADVNPKGLAAALLRDTPPPWLRSIPTKGPMRIYRIMRE